MITHYAPGEVTPQQVEEYRKAYAAAQFERQRAAEQWRAAKRAYQAAWDKCELAEARYVWAKEGMVEVQE